MDAYEKFTRGIRAAYEAKLASGMSEALAVWWTARSAMVTREYVESLVS